MTRPSTWSEDFTSRRYSTLETDYFAEVPIGALKFHAAEPDAEDESHFTVDYETPEGRGTIDGWLMADDSVKFKVRNGPAAEAAATLGAWNGLD